MALVKCPKCRARLDLDDEYLGQEVDCGACGVPFVAEAAPLRLRDEGDEDRPRRRSGRRDNEDDEGDGGDREALRRRLRRERREERDHARALVRPPAIAMIVSAAIGVVWRVLDLVATFALGAVPFQPGGLGAANDQGVAIGAIIGAVSTFLLSPLVIVGCVRMMKLKGHGLAMTACALSLTPCAGCCVLGLPLGIWGLIVLSRPDVRDAFS